MPVIKLVHPLFTLPFCVPPYRAGAATLQTGCSQEARWLPLRTCQQQVWEGGRRAGGKLRKVSMRVSSVSGLLLLLVTVSLAVCLFHPSSGCSLKQQQLIPSAVVPMSPEVALSHPLQSPRHLSRPASEVQASEVQALTSQGRCPRLWSSRNSASSLCFTSIRRGAGCFLRDTWYSLFAVQVS